MSLIDIYSGRESWPNYLRAHETPDPEEAGFDLLMGDAQWRSELAQEGLNDLLEEVRLPEFEREARAYRTRAERAYLNGWYEEALADFLEAARRNYPDYSVHRSIACLYLYHLIDLEKAFEYFCKAAKYSRPSHSGQCAEAHYFAGIVSALEQNLGQAMEHLAEAVHLNPGLGEAHYQLASLSAFTGDRATAVTCLEEAIKREARYFGRARKDAAFESLRPQIDELLERLMQPIRERVAAVKRNAGRLAAFVVAPSVGERIDRLLREVDEQMSSELSYQRGVRILDVLNEAERELSALDQRFQKQYQVDPRDYIRSLAFSPDGQWLVTGLLNGGLQMWDVHSGLQVYSLRGHLASVNAVAFSPDSLWFVSGSRDRKVKIWEALTGAQVQGLSGHSAEVRTVEFSPDGQWLLSGSQDRTVRLWRAATGGEAQVFAGHNGPVSAALFSADGRRIVSGSWDRKVRVRDIGSGREVLSFEAHVRGVAALAISPDAQLLASGSEDGEVRLWSLATGRAISALTAGHRNSITSLAFSPDGQLLAAGTLGRAVTVWQVGTQAILKRARYERISYHPVAFSPQGEWLALGSRDLQLWLKEVLTTSQHLAVREGEARAQDERMRAERLAAYTSLKRVV